MNVVIYERICYEGGLLWKGLLWKGIVLYAQML